MSIWTNPVFAGLLGGIVGSAVTIGTAALGYLNKDRELDIEMVRVSLSILAGENKDSSRPGRRFALRALEQYADVDIPDGEFEEWVERGTVPEVGFAPRKPDFTPYDPNLGRPWPKSEGIPAPGSPQLTPMPAN